MPANVISTKPSQNFQFRIAGLLVLNTCCSDVPMGILIVALLPGEWVILT